MSTAAVASGPLTRNTVSARSLAQPVVFGEVPRTPQLAFFLFILVNSTVFLRPAEIVPELLGLPIYEGLIFSCLFLSINIVRNELLPQMLYHNPTTICVLGIWLACALSHATHGSVVDLKDAVILFFKTALYYLLFVACVDTPTRFKLFLLNTACCAAVMVGLCVVDYFEWIDFTFVTHVTDRDGEDETGAVALVLRMRGTGIFEDPNDISMLIVAAIILCCYFATDKMFSVLRGLWLLPMGVLLTGLFCTRSRGGLMSLGAAFLTYILLRFGRGWSVLAGALGLIALPVIAGRQGEIDIEDGTGQERIQMWAEGLDAIKSPDIVFGIGQGLYQELAGLVAHNSYVHAYVELGFFGGTFFFGCIYFSALGLFRVTDPKLELRHPELHRFAPYLAAILAGWSVGLFSLSRCYVVPTYMVIGMASSFIALAGPRLQPACWLIAWDKAHVQKLVVASAGLLAFLYVFVKVFARFG
ncbi:MAG: O-antigen polymerase [Planctomycetaceae bacterium]|nr:O-antigen polymerase [Planctomycetaceae bacterium]